MVELIVTMAVMAVLAVLASSTFQRAQANAKMVTESGAARALISAYLNSTADHNGVYLRGYDRTITQLTLPNGLIAAGPAAQRYPHRLAAYFSYEYMGTILTGANTSQLSPLDTYMVSCFPAFGMNYIFVGGDFNYSGVESYPADCIHRAAEAEFSPLVFASAAYQVPGLTYSGYCILTPPVIYEPMWRDEKWTPTTNPGDFGNVDGRFNGKAMCAFLNGSVKPLSIDELRDMRLWSINAARKNDPAYSLSFTIQ